MARLFIFALSFLLFLLHQLPSQVSSAVVLEYGYTVSTVFDGNKQRPTVHPLSILPGTQDDTLLLLDSSNNAFYTLSQDGKNIKHLSGNGVAGFSDGDLTDATFNHPRSFTVDSKGNVYVADKNNHAIRKISKSGVTTIAGGSSSKIGNVDGPAQNATFSADFDLTFIPKTCVLLISDRGNSLIRQIHLKAEDCAHESRLELGVPIVSCVVGVLCFLVGSIAGLVARPFLTSCTGRILPERRLQQDLEALPNESEGTSTDILLRHQKRSC